MMHWWSLLCRRNACIFTTVIVRRKLCIQKKKFLEASYDVYESAGGISVVLHCSDDDYRLDFSCDGLSWRLAFMECITLPVLGMEAVPYSKFVPLGKKKR